MGRWGDGEMGGWGDGGMGRWGDDEARGYFYTFFPILFHRNSDSVLRASAPPDSCLLSPVSSLLILTFAHIPNGFYRVSFCADQEMGSRADRDRVRENFSKCMIDKRV